ncbi:hypothetical protein, partial [Halorubrum sp. SP3]|uniref:hypothetical protein n=1 Tax=Halorubrum sp. SP3 TaxID=1537265 RepID=UPI001A7E0F7B
DTIRRSDRSVMALVPEQSVKRLSPPDVGAGHSPSLESAERGVEPIAPPRGNSSAHGVDADPVVLALVRDVGVVTVRIQQRRGALRRVIPAVVGLEVDPIDRGLELL